MRLTVDMTLGTRITLAMILLVLLTAGTVAALSYRNLEHVIVPAQLGRMQALTTRLASRLQSHIAGGESALLSERNTAPIDGFIRARQAGGFDRRGASTEAQWRERMEHNFGGLLLAFPDFKNVRLVSIQEDDRELVRVERSQDEAAFKVASIAALQQESDREFLRTSLSSPNVSDDIVASAMKLDGPRTSDPDSRVPIVRLLAPVRDTSGSVYGALIADVDVRPALQLLRQEMAAEPGTIYLVNADGDYLMHEDRTREFGFDVGRNSRLQNDFPQLGEWLRTRPADSRIVALNDDEYGIAMASVSMSGRSPDLLIYLVPKDAILSQIAAVAPSSLIGAGIAIVCALLLAIVLARSVTRRLGQLAFKVGSVSFSGIGPTSDARAEVTDLEYAVDRMRRDVNQKTSELREGEFRMRQLAGSLPQLIWTCAPTGECDYLSPQWMEYTGTTETSQLGYGWLEQIHPDDRKRTIAAWNAAHPVGDVFRIEYRLRRHDGVYRWFDTRAVPLRDATGGIIKWFGSNTDIEEARNLRDALTQSEQRLRLALDAADLGIFYHDLQTQMITADERAVRHAIFDAPETHQENFILKVHPDDRERLIKSVEAALQPQSDDSDGRLELEYRLNHRDGSVRWVSVSARVHFEGDPAGRRATSIIGTTRDITGRKREEESLLQGQRMEALGTLAGGIAHDFNNILLSISGNAKLAGDDVSADHPAQRSIQQIATAATRASDLVRRILSFSRQQETLREISQLEPIVQEAINLLRSALPKSVEIRLTVAPNIAPVMVDTAQMHQVIVNLMTNAAHAIGAASRQAGIIAVEVDAVDMTIEGQDGEYRVAPGRYVRISVTDNGCGIEQQNLSRIFDPFFTTKPVGQGTGLGLSVVDGIIRNHGGTITVESKLRRGTVFRVYLPAASESSTVALQNVSLPIPGKGQHILYVDDEEALVYLAARFLERIGYRVTGHTDPVVALREFTARPNDFDAVVTDLSMPGMSGFDLVRALRAVRADAVVVMTTGYVRVEDRETALALGVRELILKPSTIDKLGQVLNDVLSSDKPSSGLSQ